MRKRTTKSRVTKTTAKAAETALASQAKKSRVPLPIIDATLEEIANQRALLGDYRRSLRRWEIRLYRMSGWTRRHQKSPPKEVQASH